MTLQHGHNLHASRKKVNKSSAVAEMGDRGHNRHGPKRWGALCPFRAEVGPRLIQCGLGRGLLPYQVASSSIQPKTAWWWVCPLFWGQLGPHRTQSPWAEAYIHTKCHLSPSSRLATTDIGRKLGACASLGEGKLGPYLTQSRVG